MRFVPLGFRQDPSQFAAAYIKENKLAPSQTLIVTPTERFKVYMAAAILGAFGREDVISPTMVKIDELIDSLTAYTGLQRANMMQKLSTLYHACVHTEGFDDLFGTNMLSSFSSFMLLASGLFRSFEEINRMEIDLEGSAPGGYYDRFGTHFEIFRRIYSGYNELQERSGLYDTSFLLKKVGKSEIETVFSRYDDVVFISPLLMTVNEKRLFGAIEDKLHVIYQDTDDHDFSRLISFRSPEGLPKKAGGSAEKKAELHLHESSTRIETVMLVMSIVRREIARGVSPHEIAVINFDPTVCEMVKRSCDSLRITSNYTRGISVKKAPVFVFLRLVSTFFDSGMDTSVLLELVRSEFFCELSGRREYKGLRERVVSWRVFNIRSLESSLLDERSGEALRFLKNLYGCRNFGDLYERLIELFDMLGGKKPYEFYTVRDMLLESALELSELGDLEQSDPKSASGENSYKTIKFSERPFEIFLNHAETKRYTLQGSLRSGVQIIGLLETRGVTFRTVVVPSFNEGYFPTRPRSDIFFSADLKQAFGLSSLQDREKLEFYYLKRLLDASERAFLIPIREFSGEFEVRSRYCQLLDSEPERPLPYTIPFAGRESADHTKAAKHPLLEKKSDTYSRLDIHRLKRCETQYYIAKVLKIEGEETLSKEIEMDVVGSKIHLLLRDLYRELDFKNLPSFKSFEAQLHDRFLALFTDGLFGTKEEVLARRILLENLKEALRRDYERFRRGDEVCVEWLEREFRVKAGAYTLSGRIDRIDRSKEGGYTILDYKTGKIPAKRDHLPEGDYMEVQLGFYGLLFRKSFPGRAIKGIGYFDLSKKRDFEIIVKADEAERYLDDFESHLMGFLADFEKRTELSLANDMTYCVYCPYYNICRIYEA